MLIIIARSALTVLAMLVIGTALASAETTATPAPKVVSQATPLPNATPKPRLTYRVQTRAYYFTRQNASAYAQGGANTAINQASFELGLMPHAEYLLVQSLSFGATYAYGNPLSDCPTAYSHAFSSPTAIPPCLVQSKTNFHGNQINPDDTLPGYQINTLKEAYATWKDKHTYVKVGNQIINQPWAPSSDSRVFPSAYQGADAIVSLGDHWLVEGTDMIRFEPRNASNFSRQTLLTDAPAYPGATALAPNIHNPSGTSIETSGYVLGRVGYASKDFTANFSNYNFLNIATSFWLDARYDLLHVPLKPFVQLQIGDQTNAGTSVIGKINSQIYGILGGANLDKNWLITAAYDWIPVKTDNVVLPTGYTCSTTNTISVGKPKESLAYFLPSGGTANCTREANGTTNIYYGAWASPYTYSYATDPLFTTSLTQGMIDRASPGQAYLARATYTSSNHQLVSYASYAGYDYNNPGYAQATHEWDFDALYYFNKPAAVGQFYHGFMLRYRFGQRWQSGGVVHLATTPPTTTTFGGTPLFNYNRFQAEYDF